MTKNWIPLRQVEGTASRQAHVRLPEGTYEREISKEGFFGPSAQFHHKHKPTDWVEFDGAIRPRAFDLNKLVTGKQSPWNAELSRQQLFALRRARHAGERIVLETWPKQITDYNFSAT